MTVELEYNIGTQLVELLISNVVFYMKESSLISLSICLIFSISSFILENVALYPSSSKKRKSHHIHLRAYARTKT